MKNAIYLIVIILFFSCAPKKVITATKTHEATEVQNDIKDSNTSQVSTKTDVVDKTNTGEVTVTETTIYDTNKPALPDTKKPPVKETRKVTHYRTTKANIKTVIEANNNIVIKHDDKSKKESKGKTDTIVKEIPKTPVIAYIWRFGIILGLLVGVYFGRKYWAVIKTFLKL